MDLRDRLNPNNNNANKYSLDIDKHTSSVVLQCITENICLI